MKLNKTLFIGAGGITSHMLPVFQSTLPCNITIMDGDILEERNLDRQRFDPQFVGWNKAKALAEQSRSKENTKIEVIEYFLDENPLPTDFDLYIACVDNGTARRNAFREADSNNIPLIIASNEYIDAEAVIYFPDWQGTIFDPRERYPEIIQETNNYDPTQSCTGQIQRAEPQLALANAIAGVLATKLAWLWFTQETSEYTPIELGQTKTGQGQRPINKNYLHQRLHAVV